MTSIEDLANLGIDTGEDLSHRHEADTDYLDPDTYFAEASALLKEIQPLVGGSVIEELDRYADKWNPGGFMVFALGLHERLGSLRLHVWPPDVSRQSSAGPNIHNHAWHLCSMVYKGTYSDMVFDLGEPGQQGAGEALASGNLKLYQTHRKGDGKDVLVTDGTVVEPIPREERQVQAGEIHTIEAGTYHIPTVPVEGSAVTLVLDSPAFAETTGVLLSRHDPEIARNRRPLEAADVLLAKEVIRPEEA